MALPNVFSKEVTSQLVDRINQLQPSTQPAWGKMSATQMLAHCNVTYEMVYENKHPKPSFLMQLMLKSFVKKIVTNEVPYKKDSRTAPEFIIKDERNFDKEKERLIGYINKTQEAGATAFEGKESLSFGKLSSTEWNNLFYKHLDHHLSQFGL